jgi:hypothetical protein
MTLNLVNYQQLTKKAVEDFWKNRDLAHKKQLETGNVDHGGRGNVTAGKNMDSFQEIANEIIIANGLPEVNILKNRKVLTLPGFFRPTKQWDMLVLNNGILVAAIEFKSQGWIFW